MKIWETLDRDPRQGTLANNGQAQIRAPRDERGLAELRAELETFVCDGQYGDALERILRSFLADLDRPRQASAWVAGFYGSGKSHLLKMIGHLWLDTAMPDGATARTLVRGLPEEVVALLRELDMRVSRSGKAAVAASGTLPSVNVEHVRATILSIILESCGLPAQYPQAQFCFWLRRQGFLDRVRGDVERAGRTFAGELNDLYASGLIAKSVFACDPNFATDERDARQVLRMQFPTRTTDISTREFIEAARLALSPDGVLPLTVLVLDEAQQYIADSAERAVIFTETAEAIQTQFDSRVMLVVSGQSALTGTQNLQRMRDRFRISVQLSDTDVEVVTRKVLLHKKPGTVPAIKDMFARHAGEVSKHLQGTRIAERPEDQKTVIEDYPLLPTRRRFWEACFRAVDAAGKNSQLRSQLHIIHDALRLIAERDVGTVIPAAALFEALRQNLINSGILGGEIATRIAGLTDGTPDGVLKSRIAGLVFLINRLPHEVAVDVGVRATAGAIADLLVEDLSVDSGKFRRQVADILESLAETGVFLRVGSEYRLLTTEGAEWDRAFRERVVAWRQQETEVAVKREQLTAAAVARVVSEIRLRHGESKSPRSLVLHNRSELPTTDGEQVVVWLRDQWSSSQKDVENEARRRGQDDPVIYVFLPKRDAGNLTTRIIEAEAARQVIDMKGVPAADAGREAREGMLSRLKAAETSRDELIREIIVGAKVYQGGGNEVFGETLAKKLDDAAKASLARLFPRFAEGDHKAWETARKRAVEGSDQPLTIVGWDRAAEDHPVVRQVLTEIGNGKRGGEVRKALMASPYGWPKDAVDAALATLLRNGTVRAVLNGLPLTAGQIDQNKIPMAEFRPERVRLGTSDKVALRGLFLSAGITTKPGDEEGRAGDFLTALSHLADAAGGEPPLLPVPSKKRLQDLERQNGSERLGALLAAKDELESLIQSWSKLKNLADARRPIWDSLNRLLRHAEGLPGVESVAADIAAIKDHRSLQSETDHITPLRTRLATMLRSMLSERCETLKSAHAAGCATLESDASWRALDDARRTDVLRLAGLTQPLAPYMKTDDDLIAELDRQSLAARADAAAAVPVRVARALTEAAKLTAPAASRVTLRTATLKSDVDVRGWIAEHEKKLLDAVAKGPVIVG